jgi:hypothetical protein
MLCHTSTSYSQDLFGHQPSNRIQLVYVEKIKAPDTLITYDSVFHYAGSQGGTIVYNPYGMLAARLLSNSSLGRFRVEFGGGVTGNAKGWLPYFMKDAGGLMTMVQSNDPGCDCIGEAEKIVQQIDIQMITSRPPKFSGEAFETNGCTFTVFVYWVSEL